MAVSCTVAATFGTAASIIFGTWNPAYTPKRNMEKEKETNKGGGRSEALTRRMSEDAGLRSWRRSAWE
eukprot:6204821-Pleurochrysis_carterae.AAC.2